MKQLKILSCLLALTLLVTCFVGIFSVSADAESNTVYYTVGDVTMDGSEHFATFSEALNALRAKNKLWEADESVEIRFMGDISGGAQDGILFGLHTIWRKDGTKLPITLRGVDKASARDAYIYLDAAGGWYACANDYTFINLTLPVGDQLTEFYAGCGNIVFENVHFKEQSITIPTAAEQAMEHRLKREISHTVAARNNADLLPAGDAWMYLIENYPDIGDNLSRSLKKDRPQGDYKHDGDIGGGMYVNACVWYEVLTKKSCVGHTWRPTVDLVGYTLDESIIDELQEAAHYAVVGVYGEDYYDDTYSADLNKDGELNILNIGSSNGYYYPDELCQMLTSDGITARVCTAYHSGVKIAEQWTWAAGTAKGDYQFRIFEADTNTAEEISNPDAKGVNFDYFQTKFAWDSITFYQTSGPFDDYGLTEAKHDYAYEKALATCDKADNLYAFMRKTNPDARYTWYQVCPVPVGYPGVSTSLEAKSGRFYADNCTQEVFVGWPELEDGEKVETSLTFGPGTEYYNSSDSMKYFVSSVGYMADYEGEALTDETAAEVTYMPAPAGYEDVADIRPVDVEATIILDGGKLYRIVGHYGYAPTAAKIRMHSGTLYRIDGDNNTSSTTESFYGDIDILVDGGTVTNSIYGTYSSNIQGDMKIEVGGDAVVDSCIRGSFGKGVISGDARMTVRGNAKINGKNDSLHAFYGGGDAKGEIVNTISGGTLTGMYFGIRTGGAGKTVVNNISGGTINGDFYGGHYDATKIAQVINNVSGGTITGVFYGGCRPTNTEGTYDSTKSYITGAPAIIDGKEVTASIINNISGGTFGDKENEKRFYASSANGTVGNVYNVISGGTFKFYYYSSTNSMTVGNVYTKISGNPVFEGSCYCFGSDSTAANSTGKTINVDVSGGTFKAFYPSGYNARNRVSNITISGGTFNGTVYTGGYTGTITEVNCTVKGGTFNDYFYGGKYNASTSINPKKINLIIEGGTFEGAFFGGSRGVRTGDVHVIVRGNPQFKKNFAPGSWNKVSGSLTTADVVTGNIKLEIYGGTFYKTSGTTNLGVYCGSSSGTVGDVEVIVGGGTFNGYFYADYGGTTASVTTKITGGTFNSTTYLGPWSGSSAGKISHTITGGTFAGTTYLGGSGSTGDITAVIGDDKGGPTFKDVVYGGTSRDKGVVGNIDITVNNGTFKGFYCGCPSGGTNGNINSTFNGGTFTGSVIGAGAGTTNGKITATFNGGTYNEYILPGRGNIVLPAESEEYYAIETVINGGTYKGVWGGSEGTTNTFTGNSKLTVYGGTFNNYSTSAYRQLALCAGGRGTPQVGNADAFIYGGTFNGEVIAGACQNDGTDEFAKNSTGKATLTIYGGTYNKPILANSKWKSYSEGGTIILDLTKSDIAINTTMVMRTNYTGIQNYEIVGGEYKLLLGADARIEATKITGDLSIQQAESWKKQTYVTLPAGHNANVTVSTASGATGTFVTESVADAIVTVKGGMKLYGATMLLTDRIALRALFNKADVEAYSDFTFSFAMGDTVLASGTKADLEPWGDYYSIVLAKVGASDFTDEIILSGSEIWEENFSIESLAVLAETAWAGNSEGVQLAKAIQNFAAIAENPKAELPHTLAPDMTKLNGFKAKGEVASDTTFTVTGKGLVMSSAVGIRIYGTCAEAVSAETLTVKVNGADVTEKAVFAGENGAYTIDLYVNAKNMSDELEIEIIEKASGKTALTLTDRVDAIAASYPETHDNYALAQQLLVYIQAAVAYANA